MSNSAPVYLSAPRIPADEQELRFIREQAEVFNALGPQLLLELVPACIRCGSDRLRDDRRRLALV